MSTLSTWSKRALLSTRPSWAPLLRRSFYTSLPRLEDKKQPTNDILAATTKVDPPNPKIKPLEPLNRPLGVRQRPSNVPKTRSQRVRELMDYDNLMAQRRHLIKEAGKGYYHDMNMTRRHGGKTWIAPKVLIREDKSLYLPNIGGKSLDNGTVKDTTTMCYGRITVLAMLGTQISQIHAKGFADSTNQRFSNNPLYQYIEINLQENLLKSFLVKIFSNSLRASVPPEMHPNYLVSSQNLEYVRDPMGMTNSKVGYVYLIDENLKIRWAGCAEPQPQEIQALESCTGALLKRLEESRANAASSSDSTPEQGTEPLKTGATTASS